MSPTSFTLATSSGAGSTDWYPRSNQSGLDSPDSPDLLLGLSRNPTKSPRARLTSLVSLTSQTFDFKDLPKAYEALERAGHIGKIVVRVNP